MLPELEPIQGLLKHIHRQVKLQIEGMDEKGLNWVPEGVPEVNSIYQLALHIADAQVRIASRATGEKLTLDVPELAEAGDDPFKVQGASVERLREILAQAADITNHIFEKLTPEMLEAESTLPGGVKGKARFWVELLLLHGGEHMGHLCLTKQLYQNH